MVDYIIRIIQSLLKSCLKYFSRILENDHGLKSKYVDIFIEKGIQEFIWYLRILI